MSKVSVLTGCPEERIWRPTSALLFRKRSLLAGDLFIRELFSRLLHPI